MATVTRENIGLLNDKLVVTVTKEDYLPSFEKSLKNFAKSANIPGFRKGMVPAGMIKKMHGPAVYTEEVLRSIEKGLLDYLEQEKLDIFAQPLPGVDNNPGDIDMNSPADYTFNFEVGLKPSFELPDLNKVEVIRYKIEPETALVDEEVARLVARHGKMTDPEAVATDEDVLNVTFEESDADGNVVEGGIKKDNSLLLKYFSESFRPQLIGKKNEESIVLQLGEAFGEKEKEWLISDLGLDKDDEASVNKFFKMTITKIGLVEKRELNEEFFKEVFPDKEITTEEGFRNEIKAGIQSALDGQSRNYLHHELYHKLLDNAAIEFPETFLKRWMETGGESPKTKEEVEAEFPTFKDQLKWTLISDKIVKDNNVEVTPDEIRDHIAQEVMGYFGASGLQGDLSWLGNYVDKLLQDKQQVEGAYRRILSQKVFEAVEAKLTPEEKPISREDFQKLQEEHQHHHH